MSGQQEKVADPPLEANSTWGYETTIEWWSPEAREFFHHLANPTFPQRNNIRVEWGNGTELEMVNREYADALEWELNREAY